MDIEKLAKWEEMPLSSLLAVLTKYFNCDNITLEVISRPSVVTRIYFYLKFELPEWKSGERLRFVDGSSLEILKDRLIKLLDREKVCDWRLTHPPQQ